MPLVTLPEIIAVPPLSVRLLRFSIAPVTVPPVTVRLPLLAVIWMAFSMFCLLSTSPLMFTIGAVGEYVGRIFLSINRLPQYVIKEEINVDDEDES